LFCGDIQFSINCRAPLHSRDRSRPVEGSRYLGSGSRRIVWRVIRSKGPRNRFLGNLFDEDLLSGNHGHVTFANIWDLWRNEKKGGLGPVGCRKEEEGSDEANKASGLTTVANGSLVRGDIGIESVYARQVPERDRDREREWDTKERGYARERQCREEQGGKGRARMRWRGANQTVHFANSQTFWFAAMKRHYLQRSPR